MSLQLFHGHDKVTFKKSIWCHGIVLSCFMDLLAQERHLYAVLWPKSCLFDFLIGLSSSILDVDDAKHNNLRYTQARLLEINSHSLFSKWFSESGKLVQRLFTSITELVEEEDGFVVVLIGTSIFCQYMRGNNFNNIIDEVESLTAARAGAMAGTEPSDGLRVSVCWISFLVCR